MTSYQRRCDVITRMASNSYVHRILCKNVDSTSLNRRCFNVVCPLGERVTVNGQYRQKTYPRTCAHMCTFAQSEQILHWTHFGKPRMQNFFMRIAKTLIRSRRFDCIVDSHLKCLDNSNEYRQRMLLKRKSDKMSHKHHYIQSNFSGSNNFGTMEKCSSHG